MEKRKREAEKQRELRMLKLMALAPEKPKPLHNFSFPYLKWGSQRLLKCMKISSNTDPSALDHQSSLSESKSFDFQPKLSNSRAQICNDNCHVQNQNQYSTPESHNTHDDRVIGDNNTETVREELTLDIRVESRKIKVGENDSSSRPWNLRTRRAACKAPHEQKKTEQGWSLVFGDKKENGDEKEEEEERPKFSVSLSKEEVEEDFVAMVGTRPPRRPKKRPKIVQKQLDVRTRNSANESRPV